MPPRPDLLADLRAHYPEIAGGPSGVLDRVVAALRPFDAPPGAVLFDLDGPCTGFVLVFDGEVEVSRPSPGGRQLLLYRLGPGDNCVLTLNCLLGAGSYPARGVVRRALRGAVLPRAVFEALLEDVPAFRARTLRVFSQRLGRLLSLVQDVAFAPVEQRLAALLLERGPVVRATQQELADMTGSAREVIGRQLGRWAHAGLVTTARGVVTVVDAGRMGTIAEPLGSV